MPELVRPKPPPMIFDGRKKLCIGSLLCVFGACVFSTTSPCCFAFFALASHDFIKSENEERDDAEGNEG